ncbi:hypothetical protein AN640_03055 [Candidatus Epulonipiscium fishelsonii]|uniref:Uncharacterized protein n=1 Tax=Candidatus Epulonipiscium fishelsonii TaxID=77094 RepID=A0ACC8X7M7_9FIRM|nr:hypothetical protein AN640_03055 [Epulopiscium sp. SCG-D08WGA-EpuloA1]
MGEDTPYDEKNEQILNKIKDEKNIEQLALFVLLLLLKIMKKTVVKGIVEGHIGVMWLEAAMDLGMTQYFMGDKKYSQLDPEEKKIKLVIEAEP